MIHSEREYITDMKMWSGIIKSRSAIGGQRAGLSIWGPGLEAEGRECIFLVREWKKRVKVIKLRGVDVNMWSGIERVSKNIYD